MGWWAGKGRGSEGESYVCWALAGEVGEEVGWFTEDTMFGVYKLCHGGEVGADGVHCVADVVAEDFLVVVAAEEVVPIGVEGPFAVPAGGG